VTPYSEITRQTVHIAMAGFALALRYLTWPQAAALAALAVAFNAFVLPSVAPRILRKTDAGGPRAGVLYYPASVLMLVLVFRERLDIVAAAWGVMAFGDGFATVVGMQAAGSRLPWNRDKSWSGLFAFIAAGSLGSVALALWVAPALPEPPAASFLVMAPVAATVIAAIVETLPLGIDDNVSVPAAAGAVLWIAAHLDRGIDEWTDVAGGVVVSAPIALLAWRMRAVTGAGAIAGFLCAVVIYLGEYLAGIAVLGTALALTMLSSRLGRERKEALGIAEERAGRRGAGNILANCLVGTVGALLAAFSTAWSGDGGAIFFVTGIAAGASDTVASEIGKAFGGEPRSVPAFRRVPAGTPGAVSLAGTIAGAIAAAAIALPAVLMWTLRGEHVALVVVACTAGAFIESALATRFEAAGVLDNNTLNLLNSASAAGLAVWWASR
jgi:uncharacterized protein (TIGR00297 family)